MVAVSEMQRNTQMTEKLYDLLITVEGTNMYLIDVLAGDAISRVAPWARATLETSIRKACAFSSSKAGTGQTTIYGQNSVNLLINVLILKHQLNYKL